MDIVIESILLEEFFSLVEDIHVKTREALQKSTLTSKNF